MSATGGAAFATAVRVVDGVHRNAAVVRLFAEPAGASRLTARHVFMIEVADLANRGHAVDVDLAGFARRELQQRVVGFLRNQLDHRAGRTRHLRALARAKFHVVHDRTGPDVLERQRVADQDVGVGAGHHGAAHRQAHRGQDVALLAVHIVEQRETRGTVGIVLDGGDFGGNADLVALEVDDAVGLLVSAADEPARHAAFAVAAARALLAFDQGLFGSLLGDVFTRHHRGETARRRGRTI